MAPISFLFRSLSTAARPAVKAEDRHVYEKPRCGLRERGAWSGRMRPAGLEPATHSLEGCCSIHLSYGR